MMEKDNDPSYWYAKRNKVFALSVMVMLAMALLISLLSKFPDSKIINTSIWGLFAVFIVCIIYGGYVGLKFFIVLISDGNYKRFNFITGKRKDID